MNKARSGNELPAHCPRYRYECACPLHRSSRPPASISRAALDLGRLRAQARVAERSIATSQPKPSAPTSRQIQPASNCGWKRPAYRFSSPFTAASRRRPSTDLRRRHSLLHEGTPSFTIMETKYRDDADCPAPFPRLAGATFPKGWVKEKAYNGPRIRFPPSQGNRLSLNDVFETHEEVLGSVPWRRERGFASKDPLTVTAARR